MTSRIILLPIFMAIKLCNAFTPSNYQSIRYTSSYTHNHPTTTTLQATKHDNNLFEDRTNKHNQFDRISSTSTSNDIDSPLERFGKVATSALLALTLSFSAITSPGDLLSTVPSANAADGAAIGKCLLKKCPGYLAKCISNPNCLANVICINTCNGKEDESGCQIECGNTFENDVVGEFNKCAVSDMDCVPTHVTVRKMNQDVK